MDKIMGTTSRDGMEQKMGSRSIVWHDTGLRFRV